jgi:hypothetical protein
VACCDVGNKDPPAVKARLKASQGVYGNQRLAVVAGVLVQEPAGKGGRRGYPQAPRPKWKYQKQKEKSTTATRQKKRRGPGTK